jgi:anthranilate synthase
MRRGVAEVRAGATLLWDSIPDEEEKETELKASALLEAVLNSYADKQRGLLSKETQAALQAGHGLKVLLIDHEDSFVHTLANYIRQTGAIVTTVRGRQSRPSDALPPCQVRSSTFTASDLEGVALVVLSPGPGRPADFNCSRTLETIQKANVACFGVCLGLQAMIEYFGGELGVLDYPMHGKPSMVRWRSAMWELSGGETCPAVRAPLD